MYRLWSNLSHHLALRRAPAAREVLRRIGMEERAVRMEIERTLLRFNTRLLFRERLVLVGKPGGVDASIAVGDFARLRVPWDRRFEVRMEIVTLRLNLRNQVEAFVCKVPQGRAEPVRRSRDRFGTRRYSNIRLAVPGSLSEFPIIDLSAAGCRISVNTDRTASLFRLHRKIVEGTIRVGTRFQVPLQSIVPRMKSRDSVGLEFVPSHHAADRQLGTLLGALAMQEVGSHAPSPA